MTWLIVAALLLLAALGAPLFALIGAVAMLGLHAGGADLTVVMVEFYRLADMPVLVAIPLFTLAGYLLGESGAPKRLVRLTDSLLGWMPGGLAIVALCACALFTAFTGASGVTIVAMGALLYPALRQARYGDSFSLGLVTSSGSLGLLFAPAVPLILYAIVAQQFNTTPPVSVDAMFRAGLLPGLLMILLLAAWSIYVAPPLERGPGRIDWREAGRAAWDARWEIPLPIVVLGGIYSGAFAASEVAAVTAAYVLVVTTLVRREIDAPRLVAAIREAMALVGAILLILGVSLGLTYWFIDNSVPERLFEWIGAHVDSKLAFLLLLNLFLLVLGMLLDIFSATVIMVPIILPIALQFGIDPVHLGIVFLANMQLGYFTPPVGMNLFIAAYRFQRPVLEIVRACVPFFLILFAAVLAITYVPWLSLVLVR
ncbi:MAG: TRAP transporter large permease subunit [Xanthomonadaceae bacterium]|jgi:tripartite ATP-independent transporter DctM subunit|nr:TRAP transporter large permease subunit [Xanthomonadaceae bacterium]